MTAKRDIRLIPDISGTVEFEFRDAREDCGLMLLQRLFVMLLSGGSRPYWSGYGGVGIVDLLTGANTMPDDALQAVMALQCASALGRLDDSDRVLVDSFYPEVSDGHVTCILELADGTTVRGELK